MANCNVPYFTWNRKWTGSIEFFTKMNEKEKEF